MKRASAYVVQKFGTIGWCFGGGQSMQAALNAGKPAACVIYYGMPEENLGRLKGLNGDVLDILGIQDQWINKDVTAKLETNMKRSANV